MARFDEQVAAVHSHVARARQEGRLREVSLHGAQGWPAGRTFVLARDAALDLGSPAAGSVGFLVWNDTSEEPPVTDRLWLEGPDLAELAARGTAPAAFGQVIVVRGNPPDDYEGYLDLKEALYDLALEGVALRSMPSRSHLWCRIHRDAVDGGFGLAQLGAGIIASLHRLEFVTAVEVLFHTAGRESLAALAHIAAGTERVVGALIKRHEQEHAECEECEYQDVCDEREHEMNGSPS